jgi:hypothetical protein
MIAAATEHGAEECDLALHVRDDDARRHRVEAFATCLLHGGSTYYDLAGQPW